MDLDQFKSSLASLGADLERWPPDEAEAAVALLATSDEAVTLFAAATSDDIAVLGDDAGDLEALVDKTLGRVKSAPLKPSPRGRGLPRKAPHSE